MNKENAFEATKKKTSRTSGFIHISEIIPGVMKDIERRMKERNKDKKTGSGIGAEERRL